MTPYRISDRDDWTFVYTSTTDGAAGGAAFGIASGELWAWGNNTAGSLGDGTTTQRPDPIRIGMRDDWEMVSSDLFATMGIAGGELWAWGSSAQGTLGLGTPSGNIHNPVRVGDEYDWTHISVGSEHSLGVRNGELWGWGRNSFGQLGNGTTATSYLPVRIGERDDWEHVSAARNDNAMAWQLGRSSWGVAGGELLAWGRNHLGQLGNGTTIDSHVPVYIGQRDGWTWVSGGSAHAFGIVDGELWGWGQNGFWQLGDGTTTQRNSPIRIPDLAPLAAPTGLQLAQTGTSITATWNAVTNATGYLVRVNGGSWTTNTGNLNTASTFDVNPPGTYEVEVVAVGTGWANSPVVSDSLVATTYFGNLEALVELHSQINAADYYQNTAWDHFQTTLAAAQHMLGNRNGITQAQVSQMITDLTTARNALTPFIAPPSPLDNVSYNDGWLYFDDSGDYDFRIYVNGDHRTTVQESPVYIGNWTMSDGNNVITIVRVEDGRRSLPSNPVNVYREAGTNNGGGDPGGEPPAPNWFGENWPWLLAGAGALGLLILLLLLLLLLRRRERVGEQ